MQAYKFHFGGSPVKVKTDNTEDVVQAVKEEVETKIQEIRAIHRDLPLQKTLLLACFSFSEDMFFLKKSCPKEFKSLGNRNKKSFERPGILYAS